MEFYDKHQHLNKGIIDKKSLISFTETIYQTTNKIYL